MIHRQITIPVSLGSSAVSPSQRHAFILCLFRSGEIMFRVLVYCVFVITLLTVMIRGMNPHVCSVCLHEKKCNPPDCSCCSDHMPIVSRRETPQMVFFTFDDAITPSVAKFYRQLFDSRRKNPNGCPIKMTLFVSHANTVYSLVREFYKKGMEIGVHSVSHGHPSAKTFKLEAKKQKENIAKMARVPISEIKGWRSPFLEPLGDEQPKALKELDYAYDATLTISKKGFQDPPIPFTLDYGWPYECKIKTCPRSKHSGFWEVPVVALRDYLDNYDCVYVDGCHSPPPDEETAFQFLWDNFRGHYEGNRAPFGINMHASWFFYPDRLKAMDRFITKLGTLNDVYIVTMKQVISWLKKPTSLGDIESFEPWGCYNSTYAIKKRRRENIMKQESERKKRLMQAQANFAQRHRVWQQELQERFKQRERRKKQHTTLNPLVPRNAQKLSRHLQHTWVSRHRTSQTRSKPRTNTGTRSRVLPPTISWQRALRHQIARQSANRNQGQPTFSKFIRKSPKQNRPVSSVVKPAQQGKSKTQKTIRIDVIKNKPQQNNMNIPKQSHNSMNNQNQHRNLQITKLQSMERLQKDRQNSERNILEKRKFALLQRQLFLRNRAKRLREQQRLKNKNHLQNQQRFQQQQQKSTGANLVLRKEPRIPTDSQQPTRNEQHIDSPVKRQGKDVHQNKLAQHLSPQKHLQKNVKHQKHLQERRIPKQIRIRRLNDRQRIIEQQEKLAMEESLTVQHLVEEESGIKINNQQKVKGNFVNANKDMLNIQRLQPFPRTVNNREQEASIYNKDQIKIKNDKLKKKGSNNERGILRQKLLKKQSQNQAKPKQLQLHNQFREQKLRNKKISETQQPDKHYAREQESNLSTVNNPPKNAPFIRDTLWSWQDQQQHLSENSKTFGISTMPPIIPVSTTEGSSTNSFNTLNAAVSQDQEQSLFLTTTVFYTNVEQLSVSDSPTPYEYQTISPITSQPTSIVGKFNTQTQIDYTTTSITETPGFVHNIQNSNVKYKSPLNFSNNAGILFRVPPHKAQSFNIKKVVLSASESHPVTNTNTHASGNVSNAMKHTGEHLTEKTYIDTTPKLETKTSVSIPLIANCQQEINCIAPNCVCKTQHPPGGLERKEIPQFIYITVDGPVNFLSFSKIRSLFTRQRTNPNGCKIGGTLFLSHPGTSFSLTKRLYRDGLEIAIGSKNVTNHMSNGYLKSNLMKTINSLKKYIPNSKVHGWRNMDFNQFNGSHYDVLKNNSLYDSSLITSSSSWPYTMDFGSLGKCRTGSCIIRKHPGVWEVPITPLASLSGISECLYADGCSKQPTSSEETLKFLMSNFQQRYRSSRTPFGINLNQNWFHWSNYKNLAGLSKFIDTVLQRKDVFIVSVIDMLHWMKHPTPTFKISTSFPWKC